MALLLSFGLLTVKRIQSDGYEYWALNAVGAFLFAIMTAQALAWSTVALGPISCVVAREGLLPSKRNGQRGI